MGGRGPPAGGGRDPHGNISPLAAGLIGAGLGFIGGQIIDHAGYSGYGPWYGYGPNYGPPFSGYGYPGPGYYTGAGYPYYPGYY